MTHINSIIKYLSNEMSADEKADFLQKKENDISLQKEYLAVLEIWNIAKTELQEQSIGDTKKREELIAGILATHDIKMYKDKSPSKNEEKFKADLGSVLLKNRNKNISNKGKSGKNYLYSLLSLAASFALLIIFLQTRPGPQTLSSNFYEPQNDSYIKDHVVVTRSNHIEAISNFHNKDFKQANQYLLNDSSLWKTNPWIQIYYAISCYEIGNVDQAEKILQSLSIHVDRNISSTSKWYLSLIMVNQEKYISAKPYLEALVNDKTRYKQKASRLLGAINRELS